MRDEFSKQVKGILANRVAWQCCFPGCHEATIGPGKSDEMQVVKLGVAAHITAASAGGPRYDPAITPEERSSIKNAIWLCLKHGNLIDKDFTEFSADTLLQWKAQAEEKAHKKLGASLNEDNQQTTLISIGPSIICHAEWQSVKTNLWTFEIADFIKGDWDALMTYSMNFNDISSLTKYLLVERQGDGRIVESVELNKLKNQFVISIGVKDKFPSIDPNEAGTDIALGEDGDISFLDDDFKLVEGIDAARQAIRLTLSSGFGEWRENPGFGSYFSQYVTEYRQHRQILERLLKLEITRLLAIPVHGGYPPSFEPPLPFIKRVLSVKIIEEVEIKNQVAVLIKGEWGNSEIFEETFMIFI